MLPKYKSNTYKEKKKKLLSKKFAWRGIFIKKATTAGPPYPQVSQPTSGGKYLGGGEPTC